MLPGGTDFADHRSRDGRTIHDAGEGSTGLPARFSHHLTGKAHDSPAITSLRLLAVLTVLFKYASARQAARALY